MIAKVIKDIPISSRVAYEIERFTNGQVRPKIRDVGRPVGLKISYPKILHGMSLTKENRAWCRMRRACRAPRSIQYRWYGEKGIGICAKWETFLGFFEDMGLLPEGMCSLVLAKGSKEFNKKSCKWSTDARKSIRKPKKRTKKDKEAQSDAGPLGRDGRPLQMSFDENMVIT